MGRKHCGKRRNCSLRAISPFPTVFSRLLLQTHKNQDLFGKGLNGENAGNQPIVVVVIIVIIIIMVIMMVPMMMYYMLQYGEEGSYKALMVEIAWGEEYPQIPPVINMDTFYNKNM